MRKNLKKMVSYYKPYIGTFTLDLFFAFLASAISLLIPLAVRYITVNITKMDPETGLRQVIIIGIAMIVMVLIQLAANYYISYVGHVMGAKIEYNMRSEIFAHYQKLSFSFYDEQKVGSLMSRITSDLFDITELLHHGPENIAISFIKIIGAFVILFCISRYLTIAAFVLLPFMFAFAFILNRHKRLLAGMSEESSEKALNFLSKMNVEVKLNTFVTDYVDHQVKMNDGSSIGTRNLIWVGGVTANTVNGLPEDVLGRGRRIIVDNHNRVKGFDDIFAIGDVAIMQGDPKFPDGHPQMAQPSIQQGELLAKNLMALESGKPLKDFTYKDLGCMATIGKNKAVAEIAGCKFGGFIAWILWMAVHLVSILGVKNKFFVFMDWIWSYFTYDQSNRMILRSTQSKVMKNIEDTLKELHGHDETEDESAEKDKKTV